MKKACQLALLAFTLSALAPAAYAQDTSANTGQGFKADAKAAGHDIAEGAKKVGHATKDAAVDIGHGARDVGHKVGEGAKKGWHATKKTVKRVFDKDGSGSSKSSATPSTTGNQQ
ncbi:MAG TPA: hypothetical protein VF445_05665 [Bordetella sp.]|uniref:hypothetical protein n=1 Tax=Bordetella sp. TaxID=28081 RepID=UPI002ED1E940